jgi:hypothetical protein
LKRERIHALRISIEAPKEGHVKAAGRVSASNYVAMIEVDNCY